MSMQYHYTRTESGESLIVSGEVVRTIASSHPNFIKVRDYCQNTALEELSMDHVLSLIDAGANVVKTLLRVTDRVSYKNGDLLWDGEPIEGALASHIVRMIKSGDDDYLSFAKFLENLSQNPSAASRNALFDWVADRNLTITDEGFFVGYKGVTREGKSLHSGYAIVDGVEITDYIPNEIGSTVEVPRNKVDEDRNSACSYGLHVGTRSYATSYGNRMLIVGVNPRDVVMVPRDGGGEKMRVCKYVVLDDNEAELTETTYYSKRRWEEPEDSDEPESDDYDECDECGCDLEENGDCSCCDDVDDVALCAGCGDEVDSEGEQCEDCEAEEDEEREREEEAQAAAVLTDDATVAAAAEEAAQTEAPLTDYGTCQWDGAPLDENGKCSSPRSSWW